VHRSQPYYHSVRKPRIYNQPSQRRRRSFPPRQLSRPATPAAPSPRRAAMAASSFAAAAAGGETAWLNALLEEAWPFVSRAVLLELRERLQPAVQHYMPAYLPSVVFTRLDLGRTSPRITSIAVRDAAALARAEAAVSGAFERKAGRRRDGRRRPAADGWGDASPSSSVGSSEEAASTLTSDLSEKAAWGSRGVAAQAVVIELGVEYEGQPNFQMALASSLGTTFGIDSARLTGVMEVIVAPLISRIPLAAGFQAAFLNRPTIDFNLTGIAAAGDMGPWVGAFRGFVDKMCASCVVLPNRIVFKIDPAVDFMAMAKGSHPVGVLRVAVLRGHGFPHTDASAIKQAFNQSAEPDVYVVLRLGATEHRTVRVDDCEHPIFDSQVFDFVLASHAPHQQLVLEAYDYDLGQDDELGTAVVKVDALMRDPELDVRLKHSPLGAVPRLRLAAQFVRLSADLSDVQSAVLSQRMDATRPQTCSSLLLAVAVDRAARLPLSAAARPLVRVMLHDRCVVETWPSLQIDAAAYRAPQDSPSWEFSRHVLIDRPVDADTRVVFEVRDDAAMQKNRILGHAFLHLSDLLRHKGCARVYNFALLDCARAGATLRVRVGLEATVADGVPLWNRCSAAEQRKTAGSNFSASSLGSTSAGGGETSRNGGQTRSTRLVGANGSWVP
jgi:C2 domain/Synaptotagmin-like mitochondrial-lipid-binding domain